MSIKKEQRRVLALFPGSLGDAVCVLPAIKHLSREYDAALVLAVRGEAFELYAAVPFVKMVISLEGQVFSQLFSSPTLVSEEARRFFSSFSDIVSWYGHARAQVVENLRLLASGRVRSFAFFSGQENTHAVAYYLRCVSVDGLRCPSLRISKHALQWLDQYWREQGWSVVQRMLVLHPGSGGKKKRWGAEGFRSVAKWWQSKKHGKVLILLGPAEVAETKEWIEVGEVVSGLSLWQVAALLSRADRYLGNDSGVSHLAGAVGARGVVVFGPTQPQQWRPFGGSLSVLQNASYRSAHSAAEGIALAEIPVAAVIEKLLRC